MKISNLIPRLTNLRCLHWHYSDHVTRLQARGQGYQMISLKLWSLVWNFGGVFFLYFLNENIHIVTMFDQFSVHVIAAGTIVIRWSVCMPLGRATRWCHWNWDHCCGTVVVFCFFWYFLNENIHFVTTFDQFSMRVIAAGTIVITRPVCRPGGRATRWCHWNWDHWCGNVAVFWLFLVFSKWTYPFCYHVWPI